MPLKGNCDVTHSSPRDQRPAIPGRATGDAAVLGRGKRSQGSLGPRPLFGILQERWAGQGKGWGLAGWIYSARLWSVKAVPRCVGYTGNGSECGLGGRGNGNHLPISLSVINGYQANTYRS